MERNRGIGEKTKDINILWELIWHKTLVMFRRAKKMSTAGNPRMIKVRDNISLQHRIVLA